MKLNSVFSSGALLLQNAVTEFRGEAVPGAEVVCTLSSNAGIVRTSKAVCRSDGSFSLPLQGEPASFDRYSIAFSCAGEQVVLEDILFGEVWLAAGQSNMEMRNNIMENGDALIEAARQYEIRYYRFSLPWEHFPNPPFEPARDADGRWESSRSVAGLTLASAAASAAVLVVAERFAQEGKEIPLGFIDTSIGGSAIEAWLPLPITDGELKESLIRVGRYTTEDRRGLPYPSLFNADSVFYNGVVAPLIGVRARGILWYQGESNVSPDPYVRAFYKNALEVYHRVYRGLFAENDDAAFPLLCTLLFPWIYGENGDVRMGYINQAMNDAAAANPESIAVVPTYDLPAKWSYYYDYHPIHPTNKYGIGERLGELMINHSYGGEGMKTAARFKKAVRKKGALELHFETFGQPLRCGGSELKGFFVAGKNGTFIPADAEQISRSVVRVSSEHIASPDAACYQLADLQNDGNLFCGSLPVAPFTTTSPEKALSVGLKPWLSAGMDSHFRPDRDTSFRPGSEFERNTFSYPVRFPLPGTSLCYDPAYRAVRLHADSGKSCGMYVRAEYSMPLDLHRYAALSFTLYARPEVKASIRLTLRKDGVVSHRFCRVSMNVKGSSGILECTAPFRVDDDTAVDRIEFLFDLDALQYPTVAIGELALIPKKS